MRFKLKQHVGETLLFTATLSAFSKANCKPYRRVACLTQIELDGENLCDHVWVNRTKEFDGLWIGARINFIAKVEAYRKNYQGPEKKYFGQDYHLAHVREIIVMEPQNSGVVCAEKQTTIRRK